jgi:hypothetical protein
MAAPSGASSSARLVLLSLLGFCVALSRQESSSSTDSCGAAKLAVASLVPFDTAGFRCAANWKQQDFVLRVRPRLARYPDLSNLLSCPHYNSACSPLGFDSS